MSNGGDRFSELVMGKSCKVIVKFKLLKGYDEDAFINKY